MISNSKQLSLWKSALNEELGPRWRKHLANIAVSLECVTKGLKTAFLWDLGPSVTPAHLCDVVRALKTKQLVSKEIHVLTVAGDAFVVNLATFRETMEEFGSRRRVFVDVSGNVPECVEPGSATDKKCVEMLEGVSEAVAMLGLEEGKLSECVEIPLREEWCVPSVFGVLSGYPSVYWYDPTTCEHPRCLDGLLLQVYRVRVETKCSVGGEFELYSFSVPESVMGGRGCVDRWFDGLTEKFRAHVWLSSLGVRGERVVMSRVVL